MMPLELAALDAATLLSIKQQYASKIKLIYFDIDGTLIDSRIEIPGSTAAQVQRIQHLGITAAIASGRPYFAAKDIIKTLSINGAGLFCTGALLYDPVAKATIETQPLHRNDVDILIDMARQQSMHYEIYTIDNYFTEKVTVYTEYHKRYLNHAPVITPFTDEILSQPIYKVQLVVDMNSELSKLEAVKARLPKLFYESGHGADQPDILFSSVVSSKADKAVMFDRLCEYNELKPENIMSIGDGGSDKTFLQKSGIGIAMGNAREDVKLAADFVTRHVDDDGLAFALELLF